MLGATLTVLAMLLAGCPGPAVIDEPAQARVYWSPQADTRTPIEEFAWCDDQHGNSVIYPCKWDSRLRRTIGWDAQAAPIAVFVRADPGCAPLVRRVKTSEDNSVAWACYYAPEDQ